MSCNHNGTYCLSCDSTIGDVETGTEKGLRHEVDDKATFIAALERRVASIQIILLDHVDDDARKLAIRTWLEQLPTPLIVTINRFGTIPCKRCSRRACALGIALCNLCRLLLLNDWTKTTERTHGTQDTQDHRAEGGEPDADPGSGHQA